MARRMKPVPPVSVSAYLQSERERIAIPGASRPMEWVLLESPVKSSEKAVCFKAGRYNDYGYFRAGEGWLPKSQIHEIPNDYYDHPDSSPVFYAVPAWLIDAKKAEGFDFLDTGE